MYRLTVPIYLASSILYVHSNMQENGNRFAIDRTEVSIAAFALFAEGRDFVNQAERDGGGRVYAFGYERRLSGKKPPTPNSDVIHPAILLKIRTIHIRQVTRR